MPTPKLGRRCHRTVIAVIAGMNLSLGPALADEPTPDSPAAAIADGQPWNMHGADGNELRLTLYEDGTGRIEGGLVPLTPKWRVTADGFCMTPNLFIGERCVVLERAKDGYIARRQDSIAFSLTRCARHSRSSLRRPPAPVTGVVPLWLRHSLPGEPYLEISTL